MNEIRIKNKRLIKEWEFPFGQVFFGGYFIYDGHCYTANNAEEILSNEGFFLSHLDQMIGEFVFVQKNEQEITAIVDRKRSIPLFYFKEDGRWVVTDKLSSNEGQKLNGTAVREFLLTGFTANDKTLYQNVFQIEAGSYVQLSPNTVRSQKEYYQFYHQPIDSSLEEFSDELKTVLFQVFEDFVKRLDGRVPILPLSGGYDSRIIAIMLKEYGVENIDAFTYGKSENKEAQVSRDIANRLGIHWDFIEYRKSDWYQWYHSQEWKDYVEFSVNGSSMAHIQDWPAVREIINKTDKNYVFIPGHSGDFVAGSHLAYEITVDRRFTKEDVLLFTLQKHHKLWEVGHGLQTSANDVLDEIINSFGDLPYETNEQASALFEYWDWKERQAKFIINSVRVYEYYDKDWEIPLWDDRLMEFFKTVPVELRFKKYLYDYTLHRMHPEFFPEPTKPSGQQTSLKEKYGPFYNVAKKLYNKKKLYQQYYTEPMEWYGIYNSYPKYVQALSFRQEGLTYRNPYNINSFLAKDYIQSLKGESK